MHCQPTFKRGAVSRSRQTRQSLLKRRGPGIHATGRLPLVPARQVSLPLPQAVVHVRTRLSSVLPLQSLSMLSQISVAPGYEMADESMQSVFPAT